MRGYDLEHEKALLKGEDTTAGLYAGWLLALFEIDRLHRLLCDLTIGGSELAHDPDRCAAWVKRELSTSLEAAVNAHGEANDLRRESSRANQRLEMLRKACIDHPLERSANA